VNFSRSGKYTPDIKPGVTTFVTDKSKKNLPNDTDREKQVVLPPGAATPNSPSQGGGTSPRQIGQPSYNGPDMDSNIQPRSIGTPGGEVPVKNDYNYVTRRTMTAYEPRQPWEAQRVQPVFDKLDSKKYYQRNKSRIKKRTKQWYKKVRHYQTFQTRKEDRREKPQRFKRKRVAYTPRHHQHGLARRRTHQHYMHNRAKMKQQHRRWYQHNKHKPAFKRRQKLYRSHPGRYHMRNGGTTIDFIFGPFMQSGTIVRVGESGVTFMGATEMYTLSPPAFLNAVVFTTPEAMEAAFDLLDTELGLEAYGDVDPQDVQDVADLYQTPAPMLTSDDPSVCLAGIQAMVEAAQAGWGTLTPAQQIARTFLGAEVVLYDQKAPDADHWEKPDNSGRPYKQTGPGAVVRDVGEDTHPVTPDTTPSYGGAPEPGSSAKVIPDSLRYAALIADIERKAEGSEVQKRSKKVKLSLQKADPAKGSWVFKAQGSEEYTVRLKVKREGNILDVGKLHVQISCTCPFFRFYGPEHWAKEGDYLLGKPRGTGNAPWSRDPDGEHSACKHLLAVLRLAKRYKLV
jgi:SWIM zinc finger